MARTKNRLTEAERRAAAAAVRKTKEQPKEKDERDAPPSIDPINLDDQQLLQALRKMGANVGPINDSTRSLYMRRLGKLMKQKGVSYLDQIEEEEDGGETKGTKARTDREEEELGEKPKKKKGGRRKAESEEKVVEEKEEPKKNKGGRRRKLSVEIEGKAESEATIPVQKITKEIVESSDERLDRRKTTNKKVSFARVDGRGRKWSDEEEKTEEEEAARLQAATKKRDPSVQIVAVRTNGEGKKEIHGKRMETNRRTIVIEEEDEENDEENSELNSAIYLNENFDETMENENTLHSIILNRRESRRIIERIDEEQQNQEDNETSRRMDEEREDTQMNLVPNDAEEEKGDGAEFGDEKEEGEELPPRRTMARLPRLVLEVNTPVEARRSRSSRRRTVGEEKNGENEEERRKTIDISYRKPRNSHRSTLDILRGRVSHEDSRNDGRLARPHGNVSQVLEEPEDMEISPRQGETIVGQKKNLVYTGHNEDAAKSERRLGDLSRPLFVDDMDVSDESLDETYKLPGQGDTVVRPFVPPLIVDTPKSSRMETKEGPRKMRGKREEGEFSRVPLSRRWKEGEEEQAVEGSHPSEDTLTPLAGRYLEDSVGMDSFYRGIGRNEGTRMNSTRNSETRGNVGKTFVVVKRKTKPFLPLVEEETNDATYLVVPTRREERKTLKKETTPRVARSMVLPPFRSPSRTLRPSFDMPPSPSRYNAQKSPTRTRPPPKPMPRRLGVELQSSVPVGGPVPAPRRGMDSRVEGRERAEETGEDEHSPASLFHTQPRLRDESKMDISEITPEDRSNIEMLNSLREEIKTRKSQQLWCSDLDLQRQMIVENSLHLKPYF